MKAQTKLPIPRLRTLVREDIPRFEQLLGGIILVFLVAVGVGIYLKGQRFDPYTYALDPEALESTRSIITGKAATLRAEDMRGFEQAGGAAAAPQAASPAKVLPAMVAGFSAMGATEHYLPTTLYEKINGRAPAYLEFNFQELTSRSFSLDAAPGQFVDVFIYTMDTPLNAFGIFSLERDGTGSVLDFVKDGYRSEMGFFYRQGAAYVQVLASDSIAAVMDPAEAFAKALAAAIPVNDTGLGAQALLPTANQVPDSLNFLQGNAYGFSLFQNVYEAKYALGDAIVTYFSMEAANTGEADAAWAEVVGFHENYGDIAERGEWAGARYIVSDNFGDWNVLFIRDTVIGGVMGGAGKDLAIQFVRAYLTGEALELEPGNAAIPADSSGEKSGESEYASEGYDE